MNLDQAVALGADAPVSGPVRAPVRPRRRPSVTVTTAALVVGLFAVAAWQHRWISDDGLIAVREIRQILAGHGPNYNPFQRDEVNTSVLWTWLGVLVALVFRGDIAVDLVGTGLVLSLAGMGLALAGAVRFHRARAGSAVSLAPGGALVVLGVAVFWDFATSGLETGLSLCWLGLLWWQLTAVLDGTRRIATAAFVVGLGPLIRPDFALATAVFGLALLYLARPPLRRALGYAGVAGALPVGYEIFRAGYYGITVPMSGLAKEAGQALWGRGFGYFHDFYSTYSLFVPQLLVCGLLVVMFVREPSLDRRAIVCLGAPLLSGLLLGCYVLRVGGDYMHGRMWIPVTFALLLPVMTVPVGRGHRLESAGVGLLALWALLTAGFAHTWYTGGELGPNKLLNERSTEIAINADEHPTTSDERLDWPQPRGRAGYNLGVELQRFTVHGDGKLILMTGGKELRAIPLARTEPSRNTFYFMINAEQHSYSIMGVAGVVLPLDSTVVDVNGLASPLAGHLQLNQPGYPGHEKWLPPAWALAAYADPAAIVGMPDTPDLTRAQVQAAARALSCGELRELMDSVNEPMSPSRFWTNLSGSIARTSLRIPADPMAAEHRFCGRP